MNTLKKETSANPGLLLQRAIRYALLPALCGVYSAGALAAMPAGTILEYTNGNVGNFNDAPSAGTSYFTMQVSSSVILYTGLQKGVDGGLKLGSTQPVPAGAGSHGGLPYGGAYTSDVGAIDVGWSFFSNTGLHFTNAAVVATASSSTTETYNFSGWNVTWNGIPAINMGGGIQILSSTNTKTAVTTFSTYNNGNGLATLTCTPTCTNGSTFVLDYSAVVPKNDPSNFGGVPYGLHLEGVIRFPANNVPVAAGSSIAPLEDTAASWTPSVTDPDTYQTLTCEIVTQGLKGTAVVAGSNSCVSNGTYTPASGQTGSDSFTYRAYDGTAYSAPATVNVNISATPPPTANNDTLPTATGNTPVSMNVTTNDTAGAFTIAPASVAIASSPAHGQAVSNGDGTVTYTADDGFSGTDSFTYNVSDVDTTPQVSNNATVSVTVQANLPSSSTGTFAPGTVAVNNSNSTGGGLTSGQVTVDGALAQQCVGGCFDFVISGLAGADATVVLPLTAPIPANAVYRKLINGSWVDFNTGAGSIASADAISTGPTVCPPPSSGSYQNNLVAGYDCVRLTIVNGGLNDADLADDDTIMDPGGVGVKTPTVLVDTRTSGSSGCSMSATTVDPLKRADWWLVGAFMAWMGVLLGRKRQN